MHVVECNSETVDVLFDGVQLGPEPNLTKGGQLCEEEGGVVRVEQAQLSNQSLRNEEEGGG